MPIYMQINGVDGDITTKGWERPVQSGAASGGVWKTTNFLTTEGLGPIAVSRISLTGGSVDAQEALPTRKAAELFERASSRAPGGKLYVATNVGVFSDPLAGHTRLIFGDDQGVFSKGGIGSSGALLNVSGDNTWAGAAATGIGRLKSMDGGRTWPATKVPVVELFVSDRGSFGGRSFRLKDVTIAPGPKGTMELSYASIEM